MATLLNKMVSWAAREAEEYAAKHSVSIQRAIEAIEEKYGQKIFSATAKPKVEEFPASTPSMFLGDANAPGNKSLREMVSPGVEESITAREASRYTEPGPLNRPVSRTGEKALLGVQESATAREASKYKEPAAPSNIGTTMYSEGETNPLYLGKNPEPKWAPSGKQVAGAAGGVSGTLGALNYFSEDSDTGTNLSPSKDRNSNLVKDKYKYGELKSPDISFSEEAVRSLNPNYSALPGVSIEDEKSLSKAIRKSDEALGKNIGPVASGDMYARSLAAAPTPEVKKEVKKAVAATNTAAKDAQTAADKGEIPQVEADRFKEERDRAYQMYNEAKSRNEWLELAQILGQAVTQFGAAQVGMRTGRSMAGLQIPGVDYGARTAQEQRLLETRLRDIGAEQEREETLAERLRREKREAAADARAERELRLKEQEARRIPVDTTEQRELRREERKEQKATQAAITNIKAALATLAAGNKKQKEKAIESIDKNLSDANLPAETLNKIQELKEEPGWFGGGAWEAKRKEVESLLQPSAPSATIPPSGKVRVRKGSEVLEIDASDLAAARADGYELER